MARDRAAAARLWSIQTRVETRLHKMLGPCGSPRTHATSGCAAVAVGEIRTQEAARSNRRASLISVPVTSHSGAAQEAADQAARTPWPDGLLWSPTWSRTIMFMKVCSMLLAAVSAPRV